MFNAIHNESVLKVDFIVRKETAYRHIEFQRKRRIHFEDCEIWIVAPEDLILSKLEWAKENSSQIQLNDVKNLISTGIKFNIR